MPANPTYIDLKSGKYLEPIIHLAERLLDLRFKPSGKQRYSAFCPFHHDTKDSFRVYIDGKDEVRFHCFGACGGDWDIYDLIKIRRKCSFQEAQLILAEYLGVKDFKPYAGRNRTGQEDDPNQEPEENAEILEPAKLDSGVIEALEEAAAFYHDFLKLNPQEFGKVHKYLIQRGLKATTINDFMIGYAPGFPEEKYEGRALLSHSLDRFRADYRVFNRFNKGGLFRLLADESKKSYGYYRQFIDFDRKRWGPCGAYADFFAGRIVFPIYGTDGKIQGFMGRRPDSRGTKWMKPSTERSEVRPRGWLYGIDKAARAIRHYKTVILVEGIFDYFAFYNILQDDSRPIVVSTLGTYLTDDTRAILRSLGVENVIVAYDWDDAGRRAIQRFADSEGSRIFYLGGMKEGQDPAEKLKDVVHAIGGFSIKYLTEAARRIQEHTKKPVMVSHITCGKPEKREIIFKPTEAIFNEPFGELPEKKPAPKEFVYDTEAFLPLLKYDHSNRAALEAKLAQIIEMMETQPESSDSKQTFRLPRNFLDKKVYEDLGPALILWLRLAIEQQTKKRKLKETDSTIAGWIKTTRPNVAKYKRQLRELGFLNIDTRKKVQSLSVRYFPER